MQQLFRRWAIRMAEIVGTSRAFLVAIVLVVVWAVTGPVFHFSDTWQLVINTGTSVVTFLMVFLIQNAQNRDAKAIQLKLDELLRAVEGARTHLVSLESCSDDELDELQAQFERLRLRERRNGNMHGAAHLGSLIRGVEDLQDEVGDQR
jgi:low affinity Fe/Cu permease